MPVNISVGLQDVDISLIIIPDDHRIPMAESISGLVKSIGLIGQLFPVILRTDGTLLCGATRLAAAKELKRTTIPADVREVTELEARLITIDENLERYPEGPLELASRIAERKQLWLQMQSASFGDAEIQDTIQESFTQDTAEKIGTSVRTVQRLAAIGEKLTDETKELIANTPIAESQTQLAALAKLPIKDQESAARLIANSEAATVRDAIKMVQPARPITSIIRAIREGKIQATDAQQSALSRLDEDIQADILKAVLKDRTTIARAIEEGCAPDPNIEDNIQSLASDIEAACRKIMQTVDYELEQITCNPWLIDMDRKGSAKATIRSALDTIRGAKPVAVCPKCNGDGCASCHQSGMVNKYTLQQLT